MIWRMSRLRLRQVDPRKTDCPFQYGTTLLAQEHPDYDVFTSAEHHRIGTLAHHCHFSQRGFELRDVLRSLGNLAATHSGCALLHALREFARLGRKPDCDK